MAYDYVPYIPSLEGCQYLFSFVCSFQSHPVRQKILTLEHSRGYLEDTSATAAAQEKKEAFCAPNYTDDSRRNYGNVMSATKFVLAPRGYGPSSWRLRVREKKRKPSQIDIRRHYRTLPPFAGPFSAHHTLD